MKILFKSVIILFVLVPFILKANGNKDENALNTRCTVFQDNEKGTVNLVYQPQTEKVKIFLYDNNNNLIFIDKVKSDKVFVRPYNFNNLKPGPYKFKIVENDQSLMHQIDYHKSSNTIDPVINLDKNDKTYRLSVLGYTEPGVNVKIYNHANQMIYSDKINQKEGFIRDYNLKAVDSYSYRFVITVNGKKYTKQIF